MSVLIPIFVAILLWWAGTGVVFWLSQRRRDLHGVISVLATAVTVCATLALIPLRDVESVAGAYAGFAVGIILWGWHDLMFLFGFVSGPRRTPCPPGLSLGNRFLLSTQAILYHELAILAHGVVITVLTWGAENRLAALTYYLLWAMRISSKLLLFSGVRNLCDRALPARLKYLASYFRQGSNTVFFPIALVTIVAISLRMGHGALSSDPGTLAYTGFLLLSTLTVLAIAEHIALMVPLPDKDLWAWARSGPQRRKIEERQTKEIQVHGL